MALAITVQDAAGATVHRIIIITSLTSVCALLGSCSETFISITGWIRLSFHLMKRISVTFDQRMHCCYTSFNNMIYIQNQERLFYLAKIDSFKTTWTRKQKRENVKTLGVFFHSFEPLGCAENGEGKICTYNNFNLAKTAR